MEQVQCRHCMEFINKAASICPFCRGKQGYPIFKLLGFLFIGYVLYQCTFGSPWIGKISASKPINMTVTINKLYPLRDYIRVAGYTVNNNNFPAAAHIKLSCYDDSGNVVKVRDFWPDSIQNVPAKGKSNFEYMFKKVNSIKRYEAEIIEQKTW